MATGFVALAGSARARKPRVASTTQTKMILTNRIWFPDFPSHLEILLRPETRPRPEGTAKMPWREKFHKQIFGNFGRGWMGIQLE
jgi:hypothetical protein